ncbi:hypothetical protein GIB67_013916 [Kingdonia uniflora]|uniref:Uncharacterized protein n=1 Tax=Kingdonia uniflora TaxID=39325 RepID=A0A7J7LDB9_9MAGN|nr:hypothetical protein GIB67_013916 [Kingdonia uniflora]
MNLLKLSILMFLPQMNFSIPQSNVHLSNEPMLTNVHLLKEIMLANVPLSIEPEPIIGQTEPSAKFWLEPQPEQVKDLVDFQFKSAVHTEDISMTSVKSLTLAIYIEIGLYSIIT